MYSCHPSFVLGFHGCDKEVAEKIFSGKDHLKASNNTYDWLGNGIYFWENNPQRALDYVKHIKKNPKQCKETITSPAIVGAIIDLGHCLNLLDSKALEIVKKGYNMLVDIHTIAEIPLPKNKPIKGNDDLLIRNLDCAVIQSIHRSNWERKNSGENIYEYDSVRGVFFEGSELYPNAGFKEKNHIQICVRNPNCIKGYFRVLEPRDTHHIP